MPGGSSDAMSLQGYRNGPATQGSALFGASQLGASQDEYGFTQDLNFTQDGTASFSDYPQFTGLSQVHACYSLECAVLIRTFDAPPPPLPVRLPTPLSDGALGMQRRMAAASTGATDSHRLPPWCARCPSVMPLRLQRPECLTVGHVSSFALNTQSKQQFCPFLI